MATKTITAPRRAGRNSKLEARFARVVQAAGSDPARLLLLVSIMEQIVSRSTRSEKSTRPY